MRFPILLAQRLIEYAQTALAKQLYTFRIIPRDENDTRRVKMREENNKRFNTAITNFIIPLVTLPELYAFLYPKLK